MQETGTMTNAAGNDRPSFDVERLKQFFRPKSIALVGASDKSIWSIMVNGSLRACNFPGSIYYVNPRSPTVHGQPTVPNLAAIGELVDLAFIMVNTNLVLPILNEMVATNVKNAVILAGGFAETTAEGKVMQREITRIASENDLALLGPNCLGYLNYAHNVGAMPGVPASTLRRGSVGIASQSGATGNLMLTYATRQDIAVSAMISTGNEAVMAINDAIEYLVDDEKTTVLAVFLETIRHPQAFVQAARRAQAAGKPVIAIKAGRSQASQRVAQAHTGALTGDDKVIDALFKQLDIVRVNTIEDLLCTADIFTKTGVLKGNRLGYMAISGGLCDIGADLAEINSLETPEWIEATQNKLHEILPDFTDTHNPLDSTGAAVNNPELLAQMAEALEADPGIDVLVLPQSYPEDGSPGEAFSKNMLSLIDKHLKGDGIPTLLTENTAIDILPGAKQFFGNIHLKVAPGGMAQTLLSLGHLAAWSKSRQARAERQTAAPAIPEVKIEGPKAGSWSEYQIQGFLSSNGIPVVPSVLVKSAEEAVAAARKIGFPVVLKIVSPDILHKSDIGGVKLNLGDESAVREAYEAVLKAGKDHAPDARVEGLLLSPMRTGGVELLVGVVHDHSFSQVMAVGIGGIFVELFKDASLRVLPVGPHEVRSMLEELQGKALLKGARGTKPADMDALVDIILRTAGLAQALGEDLESLEINPLRVDGDHIEALDAVLTWRKTYG
jgi:acyl-CoA synthetase (NDP forming)